MQHYRANPVQCKPQFRQCTSKSSSMVSVRSVFVFSLLLCQFDAITINLLSNSSKVSRIVSSAAESVDSFHHAEDDVIHSEAHHRLEVSFDEDSQHEINHSNGRNFFKKLSRGTSFLHGAMNSSTNNSNANRGDFNQTDDIHSKTHDRLVSSYALVFVHENNYSEDGRFSSQLSQGMSLLHEGVNSLTKAHTVVSSADDFHDAGDFYSKRNQGVPSAEDFQHGANQSNSTSFIIKMSRGMSFLQTGYAHILHLHMHRQKQFWGMPMMTWVIMADVFAMLAFFGAILIVLHCARRKRPLQ